MTSHRLKWDPFPPNEVSKIAQHFRKGERRKEERDGIGFVKVCWLTCCPWSHGLRPKKLSVSVAVPPAPVRVPSQRPLAPSVSSFKSVANDKGDNEIILGPVHRSPGICLTAEENCTIQFNLYILR